MGRRDHFAPKETQDLETWYLFPLGYPADIQARWSDHLATTEQLAPPRTRIDYNALLHAIGPSPVRMPNPLSGYPVPGLCCIDLWLRCTQRAGQ